MRLVDRRLGTGLAAVLIASPCVTHRPLHAQSGANPRFDSLVTLADTKMKEHGVPGVALGIVADGVVTIRGLVGEDRQITPERIAELYAELVAETAGPRESWRSVVDVT